MNSGPGLMLTTGLILTVLASCLPQAPVIGPVNAPQATKVGDLTVSPAEGTQENRTWAGTEAPPTSGDESVASINLAKQDLARRLGKPLDRIDVEAVMGQEFSAEAFNCQTVKERIVPKEPPLTTISGVVILLTASGRRYEYHASDQIVVFCRPLP